MFRPTPDLEPRATDDGYEPKGIAAAEISNVRTLSFAKATNFIAVPSYNSLGTRLARLRRAVGGCLRGLRERLERPGDSLDRQDLKADLKGYVVLFIHSIAASMKALQRLLSDEANHKALGENLALSLRLVKAPAERLRNSQTVRRRLRSGV